jgi:hypothetical protein
MPLFVISLWTSFDPLSPATLSAVDSIPEPTVDTPDLALSLGGLDIASPLLGSFVSHVPVDQHLSFFQAITIGLLQGVTELFPVSSLGHSVLVPALLGGSW